jgi:hypothetical protein
MTGVAWVNARLFAASGVTDYVDDRIFAHREVGEEKPWVAFHLSGVEDDYGLAHDTWGWEEVRVEHAAEDWEIYEALGAAVRAALDVYPGYRIAGGDELGSGGKGGENADPNNPQVFRGWQEFKIWIPGTEE